MLLINPAVDVFAQQCLHANMCNPSSELNPKYYHTASWVHCSHWACLITYQLPTIIGTILFARSIDFENLATLLFPCFSIFKLVHNLVRSSSVFFFPLDVLFFSLATNFSFLLSSGTSQHSWVVSSSFGFDRYPLVMGIVMSMQSNTTNLRWRFSVFVFLFLVDLGAYIYFSNYYFNILASVWPFE